MTWAESMPTVLTIMVGIAGLWFIVRHGGGSAVTELDRANRVLERRVAELTAQNTEQAARIAVLESQTNVTAALQPVIDLLRHHEEAAERRAADARRQADGVLDVLDLIATRLGPEPKAA